MKSTLSFRGPHITKLPQFTRKSRRRHGVNSNQQGVQFCRSLNAYSKIGVLTRKSVRTVLEMQKTATGALPFVISSRASRHSIVGGSSSLRQARILLRRGQGGEMMVEQWLMHGWKNESEGERERESETRGVEREGRVADINWPRGQNLKCRSDKWGATWHPLVG